MTEKHRRHHRPQSRLRRFLVHYRFEIIWSIAVLLGLFLVFERLSIRATLRFWLQAGLSALTRGLAGLADSIEAALAGLTLSNAIGIALILIAVVALLLRVRWRLIVAAQTAALRCPRCGGPLHRVHRRTVDRMVNLYVPVRRYRCFAPACGWGGLRVASGHSSGRHETQRGSPPPTTEP